MKNFLAHNEETRAELLSAIGVSSVEELFDKIPKQARMVDFDMPEALSEMQAQKAVKKIAKKNKTDLTSFLGAGVYNHFIPACIGQVAQRFEFITAYTPYQPEISQGTLQVMYEFQSMICNLTGMDVSNASVYDGATACAEAILMACRVTKREKVLVSDAINPEYKKVIETYLSAIEIGLEFISTKDYETDFSKLEDKIKTNEYACILIQNPNFFGSIENIELNELLIATKTLLIACVNISSLSILKAPSEYGADIVVGDIQPLGLPMNFGGPHGGFMACKEKLMRQMPGRIAGKTIDADGNQAFTLTIQTREQHIKREKATSNICSNQALMALCATLYLSVLGEKGFNQVGILSSQNAHKLAKKLTDKGLNVLNKNFYNEFVLQVDNSDAFLAKLRDNNIIGGLKLDDNRILVATTEMICEDEIDIYCK